MEEFVVVVEMNIIAESFEKAVSKADVCLSNSDVVDGKEIVSFWINEDFSESINGLDCSDEADDSEEDDDDEWEEDFDDEE